MFSRMLFWIGGVAPLLAFPPPVSPQVEEAPDNPRLRWEFLYEQRAYPFSRIPPGALQRAREELRVMAPAFSAAPPPIAGITWVPFGPERIPYRMASTGRLTAIAVHPSDSDIIYVGGAQGGVWKTVDGGESWVPLTDDQCSLAMGSIDIDPVNPEILYVGTGEQHFSGDSYYGCGVLRSGDGGATWTHLGASVFVREGESNAKISRINLDPRTAGSVAEATVLVASDYGLFRSIDGGGNWDLVLSGTATDLIRDPSNPDVLYAGIRRTGVFKSTDGGSTWDALTNGFPASDVSRINLALAPSSPQTVFASIQHNSESNLLGIWKSVDGGGTWIKIAASGASCGTQCWYDMTIAVHPTDPEVVFFGGVSMFRSINGGLTFTNITNDIHVDQHHITFDPQDPEVLYVGNDGGIYRSTNRGEDWTSLNTNLALTQFYSGVSLHPWKAEVALGGTQDNGTLETFGTTDYDRVLGGDGGFTAIDFRNPDIRYAETQWVADRTSNGPRKSLGGGFVRSNQGIDISERALFIPPMVMDPVNPDRLYFGTVRLYRTDDGAENWTAISPDLLGRISTIAPSASDPDVVYVGTSTAFLHLTLDGGESWLNRTSGLPNRHYKDIAVDPTDWRTAYLVASGYGSGHVYRTTDGGDNWEDVSGDLPDVPVNAVLVDPVERNTIFIGTDIGVFVTFDAGASWTAMNDGLPNVAVFDLAYNAGTGVLLAATHGRGMFALNINRALTVAVRPLARVDSALIGSPDPSPDTAQVILTGANSALTPWTATHGEAPWVTVTQDTGLGTSPVVWDRDPSGLDVGVHVDTIRVTVAGAVDSPYEIIDSLFIVAPRTLTVNPTSRSHEAIIGSLTTVSDTAMVTITGLEAHNALWEATHGEAPWLTLNRTSKTGSGLLWWTRDPTGLEEGTYVDTILVSQVGSLGTPMAIIDSLVMTAPLVGLDPSAKSGSTFAGTTATVPDSARVLLNGDGAATAQWTATVSPSSWIELTSAAGTGPGMLRWTRNPAGLGLGPHVDTITVESSNGGTTQLVDTFILTAPEVPTSCAADHLLGTPCLSDDLSRYLDLAGNNDGAFNLGDFVAHLRRGGSGEGPPPGRGGGQ